MARFALPTGAARQKKGFAVGLGVFEQFLDHFLVQAGVLQLGRVDDVGQAPHPRVAAVDPLEAQEAAQDLPRHLQLAGGQAVGALDDPAFSIMVPRALADPAFRPMLAAEKIEASTEVNEERDADEEVGSFEEGAPELSPPSLAPSAPTSRSP